MEVFDIKKHEKLFHRINMIVWGISLLIFACGWFFVEDFSWPNWSVFLLIFTILMDKVRDYYHWKTQQQSPPSLA